MYRKKGLRQETLFVSGRLSDFIPEDHILKRVNKVLDLSWLDDVVKDCYHETQGRPCIEAEKALRLMLCGFLHGIVHDRKLMREAQVNIAYRWFCGYELDHSLPDHSSLTRIRTRWGAKRFRQIFEKVVMQCVKSGLVGGDLLHCDASLIRADVSWESLVSTYVESVEKENPDGEVVESESVSTAENAPDDKILECGEKDKKASAKLKGKVKKRSRTDSDASMATSRCDQRLEPTYKQHTAVDDLCGVIVDVEVTTGEVNEGIELLSQIERVKNTVGKKPQTVTCDKTYGSGSNYSSLEMENITAVIPPQKAPLKGSMPLCRFCYDEKNDIVRCPEGNKLTKRTPTDHGYYYRADIKDCQRCPRKDKCLSKSCKSRSVHIINGYPALLRARRKKRRGWDEQMLEAYKHHKYRVEGAHGEAKTQHGLRRAVRRKLWNVQIQDYLTAVVMNLKKLASNPIPLAGCIICCILLIWSHIGAILAYYKSKFYIWNPRLASESGY